MLCKFRRLVGGKKAALSLYAAINPTKETPRIWKLGMQNLTAVTSDEIACA